MATSKNTQATVNPGNRPSRGEATRTRLLDAAIQVFGRDGYHAASTRSIAQQADANQALIGYHFGGKQGLYLAVFEEIKTTMGAVMLPLAAQIAEELEEARQAGDTSRSRALARDSLERILFAFTGLLGQPESAGWVKMILREQQEPTAAFGVIYSGFMEPMLTLLTRLVAMAGAMPEEAEATKLRAFMLLGQVLVFMVARSTANRYLGWSGLEAEHGDAIRRQLREILRTQFDLEDRP